MSTHGRSQFRRIPYPVDLLGLHGSNAERYPALVESAGDDTRLGRFDILFAFPEGRLRLNVDGRLEGVGADGADGFLAAFDSWWQQLRAPVDSDAPVPFTGGWFVVLGYELANEIEPRLALVGDPRQPVAVAVRVPVAIVRDHGTSTAWIVTEPGYDFAVEQIVADSERVMESTEPPATPLVAEMREDPPEDFLQAVEHAQAHIAAGDIYQANLARQWNGRLRAGAQPIDIYAALRRTNPAPFAGIVSLPGMTVISSSPERLLRTDGRMIETRPIAGTRPREGTDNTDRLELRNHPKERAEHVMLIDLERNDLGRICKPGTVEVDEFMVVETYAHVHHIVSNVRGELRDDASPGTIVRAVFPGGSITGCPKVRCMEIIDQLEQRPRGVYTGTMGYINRDGSADLNILIRTIAVMGRAVSVATGSGIVADSVPTQELAETRAKARGLLLALSGGQAD